MVLKFADASTLNYLILVIILFFIAGYFIKPVSYTHLTLPTKA